MINPENYTLRARAIKHTWPSQDRFACQVDALDLKPGERMLITGPSGSGKTTLLSIICGLIPLQSGELQFDGADINSLSAKKFDALRASEMGVIFQQFNLLPYLSVIDNVLLPVKLGRTHNAAAAEKATDLLNNLRIPSQLFKSKAGELSVGQQQRVAIARAFIGAPKLIIADEPTSALDDEARVLFFDLLDEKCRENSSSLLMVSHDARFETEFKNVLRLS